MREESGAVATEYVFLATLVGMAIVAAAGVLGEAVRGILAGVAGLVR
jgi:Flp pilus assembly pilin Flp